jgi:hypothetical protein
MNMTQIIERHLHSYDVPLPMNGVKKMLYVYTMKFYSATKKNGTLSLPGKWMELENITLSEVSQAQKIKNHMFSLMCIL